MQHDSEDKSRPKPTGLMKPVSWVLCLKILAIFLLWLCFFPSFIVKSSNRLYSKSFLSFSL